MAMLRSPSLWRHADFLLFWAGQTISEFGSRFTGLALPLVAISVLDATPAQLGLLAAVSGLPWLVVGPFVGVGVDRLRRRPVLIAMDLGRALLLAAIPLAALFDVLRMEVLYVVAFLVGALSMWFETAYQSYLPTLVDRAQLIDGNGKLGVSSSAADVAGPSLAGVVIQVFSAPVAIAIDAFSFLLSALSLVLIRKPEPPPSGGDTRKVSTAVREGLAYLRRHPILRAFAGTNATFMFFYGVTNAILLLFLTQNLQLSPSSIGLMFGAGSIGGLLGALVAGPVSQRFGVGPTIIGASLLRGAGLACVPLAALQPAGVVPLIVGLYAAHQFGWSVWAVTQGSVRQLLVPDRLQGRVTSSFLLLVRATPPLGALLGGALGEWLGVPTTFALAAPGLLLATWWLVVSPLWRLHEPPSPTNEHGVSVVV